MSSNESAETLKTSRRAGRTMLWLFAVIMTVSMTAIMSFNIVLESGLSVTEGKPAPEDIFAPHSLNFPSAILTQRAELEALVGVSPIYSPMDTNIGRDQLTQAGGMFTAVKTVPACLNTN